MIVHHVAQRSEQWHALRLGRVGGSDAADMLATIKSGEAAARRDLRLRLAVERLTGQSESNGYVSPDMQRGIDMEATARDAYERLTGRLVSEVGYLAHDDVMAGCSPDGLTDDGGLVEIKCPKSSTHLSYLRAGALPSIYAAQVTHSLWVSGAAYCDFFSFDDRFPESLRCRVVRVDRDEVAIARYQAAALAFLVDVDREVAALRTMTNPVDALVHVLAEAVS